MNIIKYVVFILLLLVFSSLASAQADDKEQLKIAMLEAMITAPAERALPIATRVLSTENSTEVKSRALFVLSQIDHPDAQNALIETAKSAEAVLCAEAVRMIGIGGNKQALAGLADIYASGDEVTRDAVLEAYLIADESEAVYQIAAGTSDPHEFDRAVEMLGAMGAHEQLSKLRSSASVSESLINAYAIAGDVDSLREIYLDPDTPELRDAALHGLMITGDDDVVLELYRQTDDAEQKRRMLEVLVMMGSDSIWDEIEKALGNGE